MKKEAVDELVAAGEARNADLDSVIKEIEQQEGSSFTEPEGRPQRNRRPNPVLNIGSNSGQSYEQGVNLLTQGVKPDIEYAGGDAVVLAQIMVNLVQTFSLKKGIKKFGERGVAAALTEMEQLHQRDCWKPRKVEDLTPEQKKKALDSLLFLTEKRDGRIKGRHCANGSKQRELDG